MIVRAVFILMLAIIAGRLHALTLHVGLGQTYGNPAQAALLAKAGDTVLIHPGNYQGPFFISNLMGEPNAWILILGMDQSSVILQAGSEGLHFSDINYVRIQDLTFTGQTGNGMNIDDGGTPETSSKHVIISNCDFRLMGAQGNNDFLKLSGLDSFEVAHCNFLKGATGGSGIDMVGCHYGNIHHCKFDSMGSNSIQAKGGTQYIRIENNHFDNGGQRSLNLGGSTGLSYFRPIDATYEAADLQVYANVFIKGQAPVAYVGSERVDVANNTIYMPEKWVVRILQETVDTTRFIPCRNNLFRNNIVYYSSAVTSHVNIGGNTAPGTFVFSHNLWYNSSNPVQSAPSLPSTEISGITGQDPFFTAPGNFYLQNSTAVSSGTFITGLPKDMNGVNFKNPPSRGAYEYDNGVVVHEVKKDKLLIFPNPANTSFCIEGIDEKLSCSIINMQGQTLMLKEMGAGDHCVALDDLSAGLYRVIVSTGDGRSAAHSLLKL